MKKILITLAIALTAITTQARTLVVYYSYTNNVHTIVTELTKQIDADVLRIEPAEKGLDYAANNYAIGSALISAIRNNPNDAASYPAIDPVNVNLADYTCIIIGAPLWWSNMAAPLQTYLFENGAAMAGKKIGLIVSSASSGISSVEGDAKRLIPEGDFLTPSLWIRSSQTSNAASLLQDWLKAIDYESIVPQPQPQPDSTDVEAVDLGLSVKWASYNIGAASPEGYGNLYGWADPTGALTTEVLDDYPSANPPASICGTEYDIATVNWGNDWRMPTQSEFEELVSECDWEWTEMGGIHGMKVTGQNGNSIFLPAAASRTGEEVSNQVGQRGCYWSGTLWANNANFASYLYFYSNAENVQPARSNRRYIGMSVRAVENKGHIETSNHAMKEKDDFSISVQGRTMVIDGIEANSLVEVYDIMGRCIYKGTRHRIEVNRNGLYLVRVNATTQKIQIYVP